MQHWQIEFFLSQHQICPSQSTSIDELALDLVDSGADGTFLVSSDSVIAYFVDRSKEVVTKFAQDFTHPYLSHYSITEVEDKNWTQQSSELLTPLTIGEITVLPVLSSQDVPHDRDQKVLYLVPGMGFGTGHHPTTSSIISLLQRADIYEKIPSKNTSIFDFGTGSGLLSIAAAYFFPNADIHAVDVDKAAIENAKENASINGCQNISFAITDHLHGMQYDLIMANIYAEVLIQHETSMHQKLCASGVLILSGIMTEKQGLIDQQFGPTRWRLLHEMSESSKWITRAYIRNNLSFNT